MMSEETTKSETSARLTAPQREARDMATGNGGKLDVPRLENWLWEAACVIRGPVDAPKFKDYILPLVFLKRLSDVFEDEVRHLAAEFGSEATAASTASGVAGWVSAASRRCPASDSMASLTANQAASP